MSGAWLWLSACYRAPPLSMLMNPSKGRVSHPTLHQGRSHWAHPALIEHVLQKPAVPGITLDPSNSPGLPSAWAK